MPKDYENVPLPIPLDGPDDPAPEPFAPAQMVRCDECLRANPPTRVNCLYCGSVLPLNEASVNLQRPALRPLERWEHGYNNILLPQPANLSEGQLNEVSELLRLPAADLERILAAGVPLPLARTATLDEATLVQRRLSSLGIVSRIMPDAEGSSDGPIKIRALEIDELGVYAYQTPETPRIRIAWTDVKLLVVGRLITRRVELKEQKGARAENRILDSSEFATDETVVDFYAREKPFPYRIAAKSFDFSCLEKNKGLLANENIATLVNVIREHVPRIEYNDSFTSVRKILETVWPSQQQNESSGWRRERPGKYSIGSVMELSNEMQFGRYSRLRYFFQNGAWTRTDEDT